MAFPIVSLWTKSIDPGELSSQSPVLTKMKSQILQDLVSHGEPVSIVTDIVESFISAVA